MTGFDPRAGRIAGELGDMFLAARYLIIGKITARFVRFGMEQYS